MDEVIVNDQASTDDSSPTESQVSPLAHCLECLGGSRGDVAEKRAHRFRIDIATI
jgi:hypothetical protein